MEHLGQKMQKISRKCITINWGVGNLSKSASQNTLWNWNNFLPETFLPCNIRKRPLKYYYTQSKNSKFRINLNLNKFKCEIPGWTGCRETPIINYLKCKKSKTNFHWNWYLKYLRKNISSSKYWLGLIRSIEGQGNFRFLLNTVTTFCFICQYKQWTMKSSWD